MSSLRVDSLRLCWLEAFVSVAESENISSTARAMNVHQSSVSRYLQELQDWLGKELIRPGAISDPDDPGRSVGITADGHDFVETATKILEALEGARSEGARRREKIARMRHILRALRTDLAKPNPLTVTLEMHENVELWEMALDGMCDEAPLEVWDPMYNLMKSAFNHYEKEKARQKRKSQRSRSSPSPQV